MSVKKLLAGEGGWTCVKEVLGWILYTEAGTVTLLYRNIEEILTMVDIPATQCKIGRKALARLVGKLHSIYLAVPGAVACLIHIQRALNQSGVDRACLYTNFQSRACRLEGACPSGGVQANTPGRNCPL